MLVDLVFALLSRRPYSVNIVDFATMVQMTGVKRIALLKVCYLTGVVRHVVRGATAESTDHFCCC